MVRSGFVIAVFCLCGSVLMGQQVDSLVFEEPICLGSEINSKAEEVIPLISPNGYTLYFSRYLHPQNKGGKNGGLDIWYSTRRKGVWSSARSFGRLNTVGSNALVGFGHTSNIIYLMNNGDEAGISHTTITGPNKIGRMQHDRIKLPSSARDVYGLFVNTKIGIAVLAVNHDSLDQGYEIQLYRKQGKGWWPMRAKGINTKYHEFSPFITNDSTLYFASNRPEGHGDFDIYSCRPLSKNMYQWSTPVNLGRPINSDKYDAYFSMSDSGEVFFVSNRNSELSDIYYTKRASLHSEDTIVIADTPTAPLTVLEQKSIDVLSSIETTGQAAPEYVYFGFNSATIEDSSSSTLELVADILAKNDYVGIELQGYSDNIGSASYNIELSKKRSQAVKDFLIDKNVPADQIKTVAFGEGTPIASNESEKGRAQNRRVRLLLLKK